MDSANERQPTADELAGMTWWNDMQETERARWATRVGTGVVADAWALYKAMRFRVERPDLEAAVEAAVPAPKHAALLKAIRTVEGFEGAKLARIEAGSSHLIQRKVVSAAGDLIHDDHQEWIAGELAADGGSLPATRSRLAALGHRLTKCAVATLRIVVDRGGEQIDFVQATVEHFSEAVERRVFDPAGSWSIPRNLRELIDDAEQGVDVAETERRAIGAERYRLTEVVDMAAFVAAAQVIHSERTTAAGRRRFNVTSDDGRRQTESVMTGAQLDPDLNRYPCKEQRFFDDWTASSAGRSGARACDHWTFKTSDWTDPQRGERYLGFVPEWTATRKLAKLDRRPPSDYELFGKLEAMDQRVGVPFGWYFYMLHGNRVQGWAGEAVLASAEAGRIVLPEHDYQVLRRWCARGYGF